jgi:hypothetical protein
LGARAVGPAVVVSRDTGYRTDKPFPASTARVGGRRVLTNGPPPTKPPNPSRR